LAETTSAPTASAIQGPPFDSFPPLAAFDVALRFERNLPTVKLGGQME